MVICSCKGVSDTKIRWLVQNGACSVKEVMATTRAGSDCGSCLCQLKEIVEKTKKECHSAPQAADSAVEAALPFLVASRA